MSLPSRAIVATIDPSFNDEGDVAWPAAELRFTCAITAATYILPGAGFTPVGAYLVDGTATDPGLRFTNDQNTGLYSVAADQLGISTGGTLRATFSTTALTLAASCPLRVANGSGAAVAVGSAANNGMYFDAVDGGRVLFSSNGSLSCYMSGGTVFAGNAFSANVVVASFQAQIAGVTLGVASKTTTYTAAASDHTILCNATGGAFTVTLPAAASSTGSVLVIKKTDASGNAVTIDGNASETIDGATTHALSAQWASVMIQCNGTAWFILSKN